jgi:hypothetical protein
MNRIRAGLLRRANVLLREQVAPDLDRLVGGARVQRALVVRSDDRNCRNPELPTGAKRTQGDLTSVRDEKLLNAHDRNS